MNVSYDNNYTLNLGDMKAAHNVVVFANLGCPWCRRWYANNWTKMIKAVREHDLSIHLKFLDKPKQPLHNGNVANGFVDYNDPEDAPLYVKHVYENQDILDNLTNDRDVIDFLRTQLNVHVKVSSKAKDRIKSEAKDNGVKTVPTIFFDGVKHPDSGWNLPQM
ncbi:MAG: hypothetical protein AJITA_00932 [Acetilactobacillus jinshanensis]